MTVAKAATGPTPQQRMMARDVVREMARFYADPANEAEYRAWLEAGRPETLRDGEAREVADDVA